MKFHIYKTIGICAAVCLPQLAHAQVKLQEFAVVSDTDDSITIVEFFTRIGTTQLAMGIALGLGILLLLRRRKKE